MSEQKVLVPNLIGLRTDAAAKLLRAEGLAIAAIRLGLSREHDVGVIADQDPIAGTVVEKGAEVTIFVSTGKITPAP